MEPMAKPPESTKTSLRQRLTAHARERWPQLSDVLVRYHGAFAYIDGQLPNGITLPLCRLRYAGSAHTWGFVIYRASHDDYEPSILPSGRSWRDGRGGGRRRRRWRCGRGSCWPAPMAHRSPRWPPI